MLHSFNVCNTLQVTCDVVTECVIINRSGFAHSVCILTYNITSNTPFQKIVLSFLLRVSAKGFLGQVVEILHNLLLDDCVL